MSCLGCEQRRAAMLALYNKVAGMIRNRGKNFGCLVHTSDGRFAIKGGVNARDPRVGRVPRYRRYNPDRTRQGDRSGKRVDLEGEVTLRSTIGRRTSGRCWEISEKNNCGSSR